MTVKKYDIIDFGDTGSPSIEGGYYISPQNRVGNQPVGLPGLDFNRANPNSYQTILQPDALMNGGVMGKVSAGLGAIGVVLRAYQDIQNTITDIKYGEFHRELMNTMSEPLSSGNQDGMCVSESGEIEKIYWALNFDENGYAHIEFQTGESLGNHPKTDYSNQYNLRGNGITKKTFNEMKSQAEARVREYNQIKVFRDWASRPRTTSQSFDYKDVPIMNNNGSSGGSSKFRQIPTALV